MAETGMKVEDVVELLENDIVFGRYYPKERLVEDEIVAATKAKRHVVRAALKELEVRGLVVRKQNRGASVRELSQFDIDNIYEMRALLQAAAIDRVELPLSAEFMTELKAIHAEYVRALDLGDIGAVNKFNDRFHRKLFSACGNPNLADDIERYSGMVRVIRSHAIAVPTRLEKSRSEHEKMIQALEKNDREQLRELCVEHLWGALDAYRSYVSKERKF